MRLAERLGAALLRWDRLLLALLLSLPLLASSILGLVWLSERAWLLWFLLGTVGFYALVRLGAALVRRRAERGQPEAPTSVQPDPDWTDTERAAFDRARERIAARLTAPLPWADLPAEAVATVEGVAVDLSDGQRGVLDFTVPEALLLIDRVALRYRAFLLGHVPLSDRLSVRTMHWLWQRQGTATLAWETGFLAWRGVRLMLNPAAALLREAERLLASGLQGRLSEGFLRDVQVILLEEAAQAAIDLYSGRLVATDRELASAHPADPAPAPPLQALVVGQGASGRSSLIDALLDAPVGADPALALSGALTLTEADALDGTPKRARLVAEAMAASDMVIWLHRANRPGRAADTALASAFAEALAGQPDRTPPPVLHVVSGVDLVVPGWPRPEHHLGPAEQARIAAVERAVAEAVGAPGALAISTRAPVWNLTSLRHQIAEALPAARRAQRSRQRAAVAPAAGIAGNLARAGRGVRALARRIWTRG